MPGAPAAFPSRAAGHLSSARYGPGSTAPPADRGVGEMIKTHGLNQVSLSLADLQRSLAFYEQLFGVREYQRGEDPAAR